MAASCAAARVIGRWRWRQCSWRRRRRRRWRRRDVSTLWPPISGLAAIVRELVGGNQIARWLAQQLLQLLEVVAERHAACKTIAHHALIPLHLRLARPRALTIGHAPLQLIERQAVNLRPVVAAPRAIALCAQLELNGEPRKDSKSEVLFCAAAPTSYNDARHL